MNIMKRKITAIMLIVLLMTAALTVSVSASSARLADTDKTTRGDWVGKYGSEGYIVMDEDESLQSIPAYASVEFIGDFWTWYDSESGDELDEDWRLPTALLKAPGSSERIAACWYGGEFSVIIDVGSETKLVTLYTADFDEGNRESEIYTLSEDGATELIPVIELFEFEDGWYLQFVISGKVQFDFESVGGPNAVISGVFFDPDPDAAAAAVEEPVPAAEELGAGGGDPAELAPVAAEPISAPVPAPAPITADPISLLILGSIISAAGISIARKK